MKAIKDITIFEIRDLFIWLKKKNNNISVPLWVRLLVTFLIVITSIMVTFPESFYYFNVMYPFHFTWITSFARYITLISFFFILIRIWNDFPAWKFSLFSLIPISLFIIINTPEFSTGGWIYSAPNREVVTDWIILLSFILFWIGWLWRLLSMQLLKISPRLEKRQFFIILAQSAILIFILINIDSILEFLGFAYVSEIRMRGHAWPTGYFLALPIMAFILLRYSHAIFSRIRDANLHPLMRLLVLPPVVILTDPDFGLFIFNIIGPIYYIFIGLLLMIPSSKKEN